VRDEDQGIIIMSSRASLVRLLERVASRATQKQSDFIASAWDVGRVTLREEKRGSRVVKALRKKAAQKEATQPREKVDKFTKQMHHKRERQMAKVRINEELASLVH